MSRFKVYIAPFNTAGEYTEYVDVTEDVDMGALTSISKKLDNNDFDLGTFKTGDITLKFRNEHGRYSNIGAPETMFFKKRSNSKVRITWEIENDIVQCGFAICGEYYLSEEVVIFNGLLNDETSKEDLKTLKINFRVLSYENIFDKDIVDTSDFNDGDTLQAVIYAMLSNATETLKLLTIQLSDIQLSTSITIDDKTEFENDTLTEALEKLLEAGNAILYLDATAIKISPRTPSTEAKKLFYGQASENGIEGVVNLGKINTGLSRTYNYWSWKDYTTAQKNTSSISTYGNLKKEIELPFITNSTSKNAILTSFKDEFGVPKREMLLTVPLTYENLELFLLDKISIDYPTPAYAVQGEEIPLWGSFTWGDFYWPYAEWSLELTETEYFKIMGIKYNLKSNEIQFQLREI